MSERRPTVFTAALATSLLLAGCATERERLHTDGRSVSETAQPSVKAVSSGQAPRQEQAPHRQYFDQRAKRYYYFDLKTKRYYWENGEPKY